MGSKTTKTVRQQVTAADGEPENANKCVRAAAAAVAVDHWEITGREEE